MRREVSIRERVLGGLWGAIVGDALGVPVEFASREERKRDPVIDMRGYGTYNQPPGTWSDDSSLLLCTVDSLINHEFDLRDMGQRFIRWYREGYWTPSGNVFDIGGTTQRAIIRLEEGVDPEMAGGSDKNSNGNGSLMRILPVALRFYDLPVEQLLEHAHRASSLTHRHPRSQIACGFYCLMVADLLKGVAPLDAYRSAIQNGWKIYKNVTYPGEVFAFKRFLEGYLHELPESDIRSSGYVIDTLEASVWCLINSSSFEEAVLMAVNLGEDTDTTACVTGGLAGVYYGFSSVREEWIHILAGQKNLRMILDTFINKS